ncbi:MAG: hypothetical protein JWQ48_2587 [Conexibacter sp.]|jgi:hypothetical protein|nr:hypothetical protein [Conexibacter sp.]
MPKVARVLRRGGPTLQIGFWAARKAMRAWNRLEAAERRELLELTRKSRGRRSLLSKHERRRLVELLRRATRNARR